LFTLRESRCHPIFFVARGSQWTTTASPSDVLKLGRPRLFAQLRSDNPVSRLLDAFALARGAAPRLGKAFAGVKHVPARKALRGYDKQPLPLRHHRTGNVDKMGIDLLLPHPQYLREISGRAVPFRQQQDHLLASCRHVASWKNMLEKARRGLQNSLQAVD